MTYSIHRFWTPHKTSAFLVMFLTLILHGSVSAQTQRMIHIEDVRVGFPNASTDLVKPLKWAPVLITLAPPKNNVLTANFEGILEVEAKDGDGWLTRMVKQNVTIAKEANRGTFIVYVKLAGSYDDITVKMTGKVGQTEVSHSFNYPRDRDPSAGRVSGGDLNINDLLIVNIGNAHGLLTVSEDSYSNTNKNLHRRTAFPTRLIELPDQWYGYEGVDAVIIATGGNLGGSLAQSLARDSIRREALERWVLQGGHLIVSVAGNAAIVSSKQDFPLEPLLPVKIDREVMKKPERFDSLRSFINQVVPVNTQFKEGDIRGFSDVFARLDPKPGLTSFVTARVSDNVKLPLIARAPYGLGKVTVIGFDTNVESFLHWEWRHDFWSAVLESKPATQTQQRYNQFGGSYQEDASMGLANKIEEFGDVPVISFAVVALFIAIYIILIGPVDYFVLKKIFKRLEYTWFTFPTVVLVVSLAAYFGAYYLKGDKLRLNKVDLIEVDTVRNQVMGTTWFAVFSPRLQNYNVDLDPQGVSSPTMTLSWLGRATAGPRGFGQSQGGLFERSYDYTPEAKSLRNLPIQVWSQKSLEARWSGTFDRAQLPIESRLVKETVSLRGKFTYKLPRKLEGAKLIYSNRLWQLNTLEPGAEVTIDQSKSDTIILSNVNYFESKLKRGTEAAQQPEYTNDLNRLVFASKDSSGQMLANDYLRYLNQSWRLKDYDEAILIGTLRDEYGDAAQLNEGGVLGTKLKLSNPSGADLVQGSMRQATFVRFYLPVRSATEGQPQ